MNDLSGIELQFLLLGGDYRWWRDAFTVANGVYAVRAYTRVVVSRHTAWDHDPLSDSSHCRSCSRPLRLFAQIHHESTPFRKQWKSQCAVCEWKTSNPEASLMDAFRLWPPLLEFGHWEQVLQFLCQEGKDVAVWLATRQVLFASPHLHCLRTTAVRRAWHSVLLTGFEWADEVLWSQPDLMESIYISRMHPRAESERAAWAILSILSRNPMWLLVASCCAASAYNQRPTCGRPMQILLAFLGGPCCASSPAWISLLLDAALARWPSAMTATSSAGNVLVSRGPTPPSALGQRNAGVLTSVLILTSLAGCEALACTWSWWHARIYRLSQFTTCTCCFARQPFWLKVSPSHGAHPPLLASPLVAVVWPHCHAETRCDIGACGHWTTKHPWKLSRHILTTMKLPRRLTLGIKAIWTSQSRAGIQLYEKDGPTSVTHTGGGELRLMAMGTVRDCRTASRRY